jgi:FkbM family methyltransferase
MPLSQYAARPDAMITKRNRLPHWSIEPSRWLVERLDPFARLSYSHEGEDMVLRRIFHTQQFGFYVDVGAHHPFRFSNTCYFYRLGWRGINIDPNPDAIAAFNRSRPHDINLCVGVSDVPGDLQYYMFNEPALNTFDGGVVAERAGLADYHLLDKRTIPVRRLDDLLTTHLPHGRKIDFISVDVEGLDLKVLQSNDWERFRPRVLLAEARDCSLAEISKQPVHVFAQSIEYQLVAKTLNTLVYGDSLRQA